MSQSQIFFHTGLSKTGSTFLQHQIFPKLGGIHYIPTVKYRKALGLIPRLKKDKILVSREFDQQFEQEVIRFSGEYPNAHPIVVFREHSSWILSNYKRFVKNGHPISFSEFIDLKEDKGLFKIQDLNFYHKIELLEKHFSQKPLVLFYEDLKQNPKMFIQQILDYTQTQVDYTHVNLNPKHVSYDEKAIKWVRKLSSKIYFQKKLEIHRKPLGFLYNLYANIVRYTILYGSRPFPERWFPQENLVEIEELDTVKDFCKKDWEKVKQYAIRLK